MTDRPGTFSRRNLLLGAAGLAVVAASGGYAIAQRGTSSAVAMSPPDVLAAAQSGDVLFVDIRRPEEWAETGVPEGAHALDMRRDDFIPALAALTDGARDRPVALICAGGRRSGIMAAELEKAGFTNLIDVPEGMMGSSAGPGWLERGLPVSRP